MVNERSYIFVTYALASGKSGVVLSWGLNLTWRVRFLSKTIVRTHGKRNINGINNCDINQGPSLAAQTWGYFCGPKYSKEAD